MKKSVMFFFCIIFLISLVFAFPNSHHLNIQVTNELDKPSPGTYLFEFNITSNSDCTNILYSNRTTITTNSNGIINYTISNVDVNYNDTQYYFCYYRDGLLKNIEKISSVPYSFYSKNSNRSTYTDIWITSEGNKNDVSDILTSELTDDLGWINNTHLQNNLSLYWKSDGSSTATGNFNLGNYNLSSFSSNSKEINLLNSSDDVQVEISTSSGVAPNKQNLIIQGNKAGYDMQTIFYPSEIDGSVLNQLIIGHVGRFGAPPTTDWQGIQIRTSLDGNEIFSSSYLDESYPLKFGIHSNRLDMIVLYHDNITFNTFTHFNNFTLFDSDSSTGVVAGFGEDANTLNARLIDIDGQVNNYGVIETISTLSTSAFSAMGIRGEYDGTGTSAQINAIRVFDNLKGSGTITDNIGIDFDAKTNGVNNYAIRTQNDIVIDQDNMGIRLGEAQTDMFIGFDGVNGNYTLAGSGVHTFNNGSGLGTIRYKNAITSTPENKEYSSLDNLVNPKELTREGKTDLEFHQSFPGEMQGTYRVLDENNCSAVIDKYCWIEGDIETCNENLPKSVKDYWETYRVECGTKEELGIDTTEWDMFNYKAVYELNEKVNALEVKLCLDNPVECVLNVGIKYIVERIINEQ